MGDKVVEDKWGTNKRLVFMYDENGAPNTVYYYNNSTSATKYYYVLNQQGDVTEIRGEDNALVAQYNYDAFGNILSIKSASGANITSSTHIANVNPLRYRGYFYDTETGFYYLNSRYYDPATRRFISPEPNIDIGVFDENAGFTAYNLYSYCANNPVNYTDFNGEFIITALVVGIIAGAAIGGTVGGVVSYNAAAEAGETGSDLFLSTMEGIGKGAVIGGIGGGIIGATGGIVATYGAGSIAGTAAISGSLTIASKTTEVAALQIKKSTSEGKSGWQTANNCFSAIFGNGGTIILPAFTKAITTGFVYTVIDIAKHKVIPLEFTAYLGSSGGKWIPYGFLVYSCIQTTCSMLSENPVVRALQRGYTLQ